MFFEVLGRGGKDEPGVFYSVVDRLIDDVEAVSTRPVGDSIREGILHNPVHGAFPRLWQALDDADAFLRKLLDPRLMPPGKVHTPCFVPPGAKYFEMVAKAEEYRPRLIELCGAIPKFSAFHGHRVEDHKTPGDSLNLLPPYFHVAMGSV